MFGIFEVSMGSNGLGIPRALFPSFAEAVAYAESTYKIEVLELDGDDAADFITAAGTIFAIQETDRRVVA
jgi:hypothetical protein